MEKIKTLQLIRRCAALVMAGALGAQAANVTKLDTTTMAGGAADWSAAPGTTDVGEFDATPSATTLANMTLGGDLTLGGLQLDGTLNGPLTIAAGNTLTLNAASGINLTAANFDCTLNCGLNVNVAQTWSVAAGRGFTAGNVGGFPSGKILTVQGGGSVTVGNMNTGNGTGGLLIKLANGSYSGADLNIQRYGQSTTTVPTATSPVSAQTSQGFYVNAPGSSVSFNTIEISTGNAGGSGRVDDGNVTVTNAVTIGRSTSGSTTGTGRGAYFQVNGGSFIALDSVNGVVISPNNAAGNQNLGEFYISAGTATANRIAFGSATDVNGGKGIVILKGSGALYVGSGGIVMDTPAVDYAATVGLYSGLLGAAADWSSAVPMTLSGPSGAPFNIQAADAANLAHDISLSGVLSGSGALTKTGGGRLTLGGINTYSGPTEISAGTLALDVNGTMASTPVTVDAGATYDVSQASGGGNMLTTGQTIAGLGTVAGLTASTGSHITPADATSQGTLNFTGGLTLADANVDMELTDDPTGVSKVNDFINITGDLTLSGTTVITVTPVGSLAVGTYKLMHFSGSLNGSLASLTCASGVLSNPPGSGDIDLVVDSVRPVGHLVWRGDGAANVWDTTGASNWLNGANLGSFYTGDYVTLDDTATNFTVNLAGNVSPAAAGVVLVDATNDYTIADAGGGVIHGLTGLTKTNTGTLTITATANDYTGVTTINGGILSLASVASGGSPSPIGAAPADPASLVIDGGVLEYTGTSQSTDHGATLGTNGAAISVTNGTEALTLSGTVTGPGSLAKIGDGTLILSGANSYTGGNWLQGGTLQINNAVSALAGPVTFDGGTLLLKVSGQQTYSNPLTVTNTGTLISSGGNNNVFEGAWSGAGTLNVNVASGGYFTINKNMTTNFTGTILLTADSAGTFRFNGGGNATSQQQSSGSATATFDLGNSSVTLLNRNGGGDAYGTYYLGALAGGSGSFVRGAANSGTSSTYQIGDKNLSSVFAGTIANNTGPVGIVKTGTGTLTLAGQNTYTLSTVISNGVLALASNPDTFADGSIDNSSAINVLAGGVLDVSGRSDGSLQLGGSQTLQGQGVIRGSLSASGTVAPGNSASTGILTVTNAVNLYGTTLMKLNRDSTPNSDRLVSSLSGIMYGGTLVVTNAGARLQVGDTFTLFNGAGLNSGTFAAITLPSHYTWDTSNLGLNGTIQVAAVLPPPAISTVDYSTLANGYITMNAINGTANGLVNVLTSTNLAAPLSSWTLVAAGAFDNNGNFSTSVSVDPTAPQSFFVLQAN